MTAEEQRVLILIEVAKHLRAALAKVQAQIEEFKAKFNK